MEFDSVIKKRHSVRSFTNKKVSWKIALDAIEAANQCPFAGNNNNLKFLIIENKETIKKISELAEQPWISKSNLLVVVCSDDRNLENLYGERGRVYSRQQAGAAIQTILLKLASLDLSSCWVGSYTDTTFKKILNIPPHIQIEAIIPIGYEDKSHPEKPRKKHLENVLYWEKWGDKKRPTSLRESYEVHKQEKEE